jgi:hypothetical protein
MVYRVTEFPGVTDRILVLQATTQEELDALLAAARMKGWDDYVLGIEPDTLQPSAWMRKPAE